MKNGNKWIIAILGMAATAALAGCQSETSKAIDGLEDFVSVASYDDIHVFNSNITIDSRTLNGQKVTGTSRQAGLYADGNFQIAAGTANYIGYTYAGETSDQYFLLNTKAKTGKVYDSSHALDATRDIVQNQLRTDYGELAAIYEGMKSTVGKSAEELGYVDYSLRRTIAPGVAGYVSLAHKVETTETGSIRTEINRYLMLDFIEDKWCFTNYSERKTIEETIVNPEKGTTVNTEYVWSDYTIKVGDSYPTLAVQLSSYILKPASSTSDAVTFGESGPLSTK